MVGKLCTVDCDGVATNHPHTSDMTFVIAQFLRKYDQQTIFKICGQSGTSRETKWVFFIGGKIKNISLNRKLLGIYFAKQHKTYNQF